MKNFKPESLHFYMANLSSMRKIIAPQLLKCYEQWLVDQSLTPLEEYITMAREHWLKLARDMIELKETTTDNTRYSTTYELNEIDPREVDLIAA